MLNVNAPKKQLFGIIAAAVASISLGVVTPAARIAYDHGVNATTLVAFRAILAVILVGLAISLFRRSWSFDIRAIKSLLATTLGILMVAFGYMSSVLFIPVSLSALIFFTFPIIVLLYTTVVNRIPPDLITITAFFAAFIGLALAIGPSFDVLDWRGVLCAAIAAVGASLVMVAGAAATRSIDPLTLTFYTQVLCLPIIFVALLIVGNIALPFRSSGWAALFIAAIGYIAGICLILLAVRFANPARVSMINNLEPLITLVTAAVILEERMSFLQYWGGGLVLGAIILATQTTAEH